MAETRREFLYSVGGAGAFASVVLGPEGLARVLAAGASAGDAPAASLAGEEGFWGEIQRAYTVNRSVINLNNGGVSPAPFYAQEAMRRHLEYSNQSPAMNLWRRLDPQVETVRERLARGFGCDTEEMAITRNVSEAMEISLLGMDLERGDEILTTDQDYPRMLNTIRQRVQREGIVLKSFNYPTPPPSVDFLAEEYEKHVTSRTKVILISHITTYTGLVFPVRRICAMARARGIKTIVDGAHAFAQVAFDGGAIGCDYYGTSLHKWLTAPHGTGFLYVRKENIAGHWPLMAAPEEKTHDIRKFEEIGTHPTANRLAISEALTLHEGIGPARKEARLRFLRDRCVAPLVGDKRVRFYTSLAPEQSCALCTFGIEGIDPGDLANFLWKEHRIVVTGINFGEIHGIRVSPNVYTTLAEIDLFHKAMEEALAGGVTRSETEK